MPLAALLLAAAPVVGCDDRITGAFREYPSGRREADSFRIEPRRDRVFGPLAFSGLRTYIPEWDRMVEEDQWIKSIALVRPGRRATITIPRSQRSWMKLTWGNGYSATFKACRSGGSGSSGNTAWSGGFEFDYANAPKQGRCAKIRVRYDGRTRTRRLLGPNVPGC